MSNDLEQILELKVSFQKDTWAKPNKEISILEILNEIKGDIYSSKVNKLRQFLIQGDNEAYKAEKLKLPAITFCATFSEKRTKETIKNYNYLIVIDIDKLNQEQLEKTIEDLKNDEYVFAFWISPSNNGVKGLVKISYNLEIANIDNFHKSAFNKLSSYFLLKYNITLDSSGNDTTRLCFLSHDPNIFIKQILKYFEINSLDIQDEKAYLNSEIKKSKIYNTSKKNALFNPANKNLNTNKREIKDIINYLTKKKIIITDKYEVRYKIAYAIANTFTFDLGLKFYLDICKIEIEKYNENKLTLLLEYCYQNNSGWTKFVYFEELVKKYGYIKKHWGELFSNGANQ